MVLVCSEEGRRKFEMCFFIALKTSLQCASLEPTAPCPPCSCSCSCARANGYCFRLQNLPPWAFWFILSGLLRTEQPGSQKATGALGEKLFFSRPAHSIHGGIQGYKRSLLWARSLTLEPELQATGSQDLFMCYTWSSLETLWGHRCMYLLVLAELHLKNLENIYIMILFTDRVRNSLCVSKNTSW